MSVSQYDMARKASLASAGVMLPTSELKLADITDIETQFGDVEMTIRTANRQRPSKQFKDSPLVLRRRVTYNGQLKSTQLEIKSDPIRTCLKEVLNDFPTLDMTAKVVIIPKPYEPLFFAAEDIHRYISERASTTPAHSVTVDQGKVISEADFNETRGASLSHRKVRDTFDVNVTNPSANTSAMVETDGAEASMNPEITKTTDIDHLMGLQSFMDDNLGDTKQDYERLIKVQKVVSFDILWTLFKPGICVIERQLHYVQAYFVVSSSITEHNGVILQVIECVSWDYDGIYYGPKPTQFQIESFPGTKRISTLPLYPIKYHDRAGSKARRKQPLEHVLRANGAQWRKLLNNAYRNYRNIAWMNQDLVDGNAREDQPMPSFVSGPIILDYKTHCQENPGQVTTLQLSSSISMYKNVLGSFYKAGNHQNHSQLIDNENLTSPALVRGFSLVEKAWGFFLVEHVEESHQSSDIDDILVLPDGVRELITGMISGHDPERAVDFVPGKGRGLIFLLQGSPGCGKTLTAEAMASRTKRPLYTLTGGFLGMDAEKVNRELRIAFDRAKSWNAIVLIDEADIYLASRVNLDLQRTILVSVFLHRLEYFEGILFMTTNQPSAVDVAFESRITVTIQYPKLHNKDLVRILMQIVDNVTTQSPNIEFHPGLEYLMRDFLISSADTDWINGRALKSLVSSAISLAKGNIGTVKKSAENAKLIRVDWSYFKDLLDAAKKNKDYLDSFRNPDGSSNGQDR